MNEIVSRMINTQLLLFLYMLCGFIVSRLNIIREDNRAVLVRLPVVAVLVMLRVATRMRRRWKSRTATM